MAHPTPHPLPPAPGAGRGERRQLATRASPGAMSPLKRREGPGPWAPGGLWDLSQGRGRGAPEHCLRVTPPPPPLPSARERSGRPSSLPGPGQGGQRPPAAALSSSFSQPPPPPTCSALNPNQRANKFRLESSKIPQGPSQQFSTPGGSAPSGKLRGSGERRRIHWLPSTARHRIHWLPPAGRSSREAGVGEGRPMPSHAFQVQPVPFRREAGPSAPWPSPGAAASQPSSTLDSCACTTEERGPRPPSQTPAACRLKRGVVLVQELPNRPRQLRDLLVGVQVAVDRLPAEML